eukprot:5874523-Pleurochrysis_carterae.AAC.1
MAQARYAEEARRAALAPLITLMSAAFKCVPVQLTFLNYSHIKSSVIALQTPTADRARDCHCQQPEAHYLTCPTS